MRRQRIILLVLTFAFFIFKANAQIAGQESKKPIKILAIGNSFSEDAVESYLRGLLEADSVEAVIGSMVVGGATLEQQWRNALREDTLYRYTKINWMENSRVVKRKVALLDGIMDEDWDYITFQQVSHQSGIYESYFPYINNLITYVKSKALNADVQFAMHQTWAYNNESTHFGFANYNKSQQKMYKAIVQTVDAVAKEVGITVIIPTGVAIQNCREALPEIDFCRDGFHLAPLGRYAAACTWYEKIFDRSVLDNTFYPAKLDKAHCDIVKKMVHRAVHSE